MFGFNHFVCIDSGSDHKFEVHIWARGCPGAKRRPHGIKGEKQALLIGQAFSLSQFYCFFSPYKKLMATFGPRKTGSCEKKWGKNVKVREPDMGQAEVFGLSEYGGGI